jgi:hypothetical protein
MLLYLLLKYVFFSCRGSSVVEQRIENPCVTSSILVPGKTPSKKEELRVSFLGPHSVE